MFKLSFLRVFFMSKKKSCYNQRIVFNHLNVIKQSLYVHLKEFKKKYINQKKKDRNNKSPI